jgi:Nuclease-related domain
MVPLTVMILTALCAFVLAFALGFLSGRAVLDQKHTGEALVANAIEVCLPKPHVLMNNVTLETERGTTQTDHILILPTGIFVIETKHYQGWIFGKPDQKQWTQVIYHKKSRFQNPIHQNYAHVKALQSLFNRKR